jgi:hypothetical protein
VLGAPPRPDNGGGWLLIRRAGLVLDSLGEELRAEGGRGGLRGWLPVAFVVMNIRMNDGTARIQLCGEYSR